MDISWNIVNPTAETGNWSIYAGHAGEILVAISPSDETFLSIDGGDTWNEITLSVDVSVVGISDTYLYWHDRQKFYRYDYETEVSTNVGPIDISPSAFYYYGEITCNKTGDKILLSQWRQSGSGGDYWGLSFSDDYGDTWTRLIDYDDYTYTYVRVENVVMDEDGNSMCYTLAKYYSGTPACGIHWSNDGSTWTEILNTTTWTSPMGPYNRTAINAFAISENGEVIAFAEGYLSNSTYNFPQYFWISTDYGANWSKITMHSDYTNHWYGRVGRVALTANGQKVFIYVSPQTISYAQNEIAYYSDDYGQTFETPIMTGQADITYRHPIKSYYLGETSQLFMMDRVNIYLSSAGYLIKAVSTALFESELKSVLGIAKADIASISSQPKE